MNKKYQKINEDTHDIVEVVHNIHLQSILGTAFKLPRNEKTIAHTEHFH